MGVEIGNESYPQLGRHPQSLTWDPAGPAETILLWFSPIWAHFCHFPFALAFSLSPTSLFSSCVPGLLSCSVTIAQSPFGSWL